MAISTYSELQTSVKKHLSRESQPGFSDMVPDFIAIAESWLNTEVPLLANIVDGALTGVVSSRSIALPSDFLAAYSLRNTTDAPFELLETRIAGAMPYSDTAGRPAYWAVDETWVVFERPCDVAYTFAFRYRKSFALSDSAPTNALLTKHPDVYLYATLDAAMAFIDDDPTYAQMVRARRDAAVAAARKRARLALGTPKLGVDPALAGIGGRRGSTWWAA